MHDLLRNKSRYLVLTSLVFLLLQFFANTASAQLRNGLNMEESDSRPYHIGIVVMLTQNSFHISQHPQFLLYDSVLAINPENTTGFGLGGMHTFRISDHFEARVVFPQLLFVSKAITYDLKYPGQGGKEKMTKQVESILLGVPVQLKFRSDRINNFRVYMMGGFKIESDLSAKANSTNSEDLIKLKKINYGIEAGIGFNFYMQYFILSPELKISNGLNNVHSRDANLKFSNTIDKIQSRQIVFSLIFEG